MAINRSVVSVALKTPEGKAARFSISLYGIPVKDLGPGLSSSREIVESMKLSSVIDYHAASMQPVNEARLQPPSLTRARVQMVPWSDE